MRELFKNKEIIKKIFTYSVSGIIVVFAIYLFQNFSIVTDFFKELMNVLAPFIWGLIFAFILCRLADHSEKLLPEKMTFKTKRMVSTFMSIIILMLVTRPVTRMKAQSTLMRPVICRLMVARSI